MPLHVCVCVSTHIYRRTQGADKQAFLKTTPELTQDIGHPTDKSTTINKRIKKQRSSGDNQIWKAKDRNGLPIIVLIFSCAELNQYVWQTQGNFV